MERHYRSICLKFCGMMHSTMKQIPTKNGLAWSVFVSSTELCLGQEDEIEEITLWPEIWWHEADHCMKWPHSPNVRSFWSRPAKGVVVLWTSCEILFLHTEWCLGPGFLVVQCQIIFNGSCLYQVEQLTRLGACALLIMEPLCLFCIESCVVQGWF